MSIFEYTFMRHALIAAALIALIAPCIGVVIVLKRLSGIGEATSHSALGGIAFGMAFGINPVVSAIIFSVFAALGIEGFRRRFSKYSEISASVVMSAGIGLTALFSGFIKSGNANLNSFMFGSIVAVSDFELGITIGLCAIIVCASVMLYKELFYITFDEEAAFLSGMPVRKINFVFMILTAMTVAVASRIVGALMISSLIVIPVACSMMVAKSYKQTLIYAILFSEIFTLLGLILSFYFDLRPGGIIVILGVVILMILVIKNSFHE